jgi:hypothetical protein
VTQSYYKPFVEELDRIADVSELQAFHAHLVPYTANGLFSNSASHVTEICTIHFPGDYSAEDKDQFQRNISEFSAVIEMNEQASIGIAGGWAAEKVLLRSEETTAFIACIGWRSAAEHLAFRETKLFEDNKHLVDGAKGLKHIHMVHISTTQVNRGRRF